ncbi:hypothetical protein C5167_040149 [Papaver somniferum]|uniref:Uncharacterized protein n=1 Tax=Papaver somniferum TaxID=3469 RepID=A0A4Y7IIB2_PAPSO|nr:uncharacterized protein LOC113335815 [Papaver somniferum]RZC47178.1 hypothetical protein C5167_040149 [Papaver somniferum]
MKEDRIIIERVITVEYLQSSMATNLLCKFPDNSAFDFDYTQSGIWSPLLHRGGGPLALKTSISADDIRRKLLDDDEKENLLNGNENMITSCSNVTEKMKNKIGVKMMKMMTKKMKNKNKSSSSSLDLSITPMAKKGFTPQKGWEKVLRAASKQFKKQKCLPSSLQMKFPKFLNN